MDWANFNTVSTPGALFTVDCDGSAQYLNGILLTGQ